MNIINPPLYTVSRLNTLVRHLLADEFADIRVSGEISNLSAPSSGHVYFSLKDHSAQIRCAMFRTRLQRAEVALSNGMQVTVRGQVSLYEPRGDYQLIVAAIEAEGDGALRRNFELLKQKLAAEGLFAAEHKQALPRLPRTIGVLTSPSGAAIRDILSVLQRRFPAIPIILYPTAVQGEAAKFEIAQALQTANQRQECDVLILSRGGGSLEDLWAFNEEIVARAIFASAIPVITGIGHEIDFTIADFVADVRAPTPSVAAEHVVPEQQQWLQHWRRLDQLLAQRMLQTLKQQRQNVVWLSNRLQQQHPQQQLRKHAQTLDQLEIRLRQAINSQQQRMHSRILQQQARLWRHNPAAQLQAYRQQQDFLAQRLQRAWQQLIQRERQRVNSAAQTLQALSPLATLERGYAIVRKADDANAIITNSQHLQVGDLLHTRFAQGTITSLVQEIQP